jgi:hypothetical protein
MAKRKWKVQWSYGYVGTENEEEVDAMEYLGVDEEEFDAMSDEEVGELLSQDFYEGACERVDCGATPIDDD